jgi:hypothetical protein
MSSPRSQLVVFSRCCYLGRAAARRGAPVLVFGSRRRAAHELLSFETHPGTGESTQPMLENGPASLDVICLTVAPLRTVVVPLALLLFLSPVLRRAEGGADGGGSVVLPSLVVGGVRRQSGKRMSEVLNFTTVSVGKGQGLTVVRDSAVRDATTSKKAELLASLLSWVKTRFFPLSTSAMTPEDPPFSDVGEGASNVARCPSFLSNSHPYTAAGNGVREREGTYLCTA